MGKISGHRYIVGFPLGPELLGMAQASDLLNQGRRKTKLYTLFSKEILELGGIILSLKGASVDGGTQGSVIGSASPLWPPVVMYLKID